MLASQPEEAVTASTMREMLADHQGAPDSICRHPAGASDTSKTVFWCVADVTQGRITFGRGNPCDSQAQVYDFEDYASEGGAEADPSV
jgi:hypothetical protein